MVNLIMCYVHFFFLQLKMQQLVSAIYKEIGLNNTGATHLQS